MTNVFFLKQCKIKLPFLALGGGQVVSVLAIYSYDPSLNPAEVCTFFYYNVA